MYAMGNTVSILGIAIKKKNIIKGEKGVDGCGVVKLLKPNKQCISTNAKKVMRENST
jgi:hypothetical protein